MPDEPVLREQARAAIKSGKLPRRPADHTWGGPGAGASCAVCGKPVSRAEMELDIEFDQPAGDRVTFHLHVRCFAAWEFERTKPNGGGAPTVSSTLIPPVS